MKLLGRFFLGNFVFVSLIVLDASARPQTKTDARHEEPWRTLERPKRRDECPDCPRIPPPGVMIYQRRTLRSMETPQDSLRSVPQGPVPQDKDRIIQRMSAKDDCSNNLVPEGTEIRSSPKRLVRLPLKTLPKNQIPFRRGQIVNNQPNRSKSRESPNVPRSSGRRSKVISTTPSITTQELTEGFAALMQSLKKVEESSHIIKGMSKGQRWKRGDGQMTSSSELNQTRTHAQTMTDDKFKSEGKLNSSDFVVNQGQTSSSTRDKEGNTRDNFSSQDDGSVVYGIFGSPAEEENDSQQKVKEFTNLSNVIEKPTAIENSGLAPSIHDLGYSATDATTGEVTSDQSKNNAEKKITGGHDANQDAHVVENNRQGNVGGDATKPDHSDGSKESMTITAANLESTTTTEVGNSVDGMGTGDQEKTASNLSHTLVVGQDDSSDKPDSASTDQDTDANGISLTVESSGEEDREVYNASKAAASLMATSSTGSLFNKVTGSVRSQKSKTESGTKSVTATTEAGTSTDVGAVAPDASNVTAPKPEVSVNDGFTTQQVNATEYGVSSDSTSEEISGSGTEQEESNSPSGTGSTAIHGTRTDKESTDNSTAEGNQNGDAERSESSAVASVDDTTNGWVAKNSSSTNSSGIEPSQPPEFTPNSPTQRNETDGVNVDSGTAKEDHKLNSSTGAASTEKIVPVGETLKPAINESVTTNATIDEPGRQNLDDVANGHVDKRFPKANLSHPLTENVAGGKLSSDVEAAKNSGDAPNEQNGYQKASEKATAVLAENEAKTRRRPGDFLPQVLKQPLSLEHALERSVMDSLDHMKKPEGRLSKTYSTVLAESQEVVYRIGMHEIAVPITQLKVEGVQDMLLLKRTSNLDEMMMNLTITFENITISGKFDASGSISGLNRNRTRYLKRNYPSYGNGSIFASVDSTVVVCQMDLQHSTNDRKLSIENLAMQMKFKKPHVKIDFKKLPRTLEKLRFRINFPEAVSKMISRKLISQIQPMIRYAIWENVSIALNNLVLDAATIDSAIHPPPVKADTERTSFGASLPVAGKQAEDLAAEEPAEKILE